MTSSYSEKIAKLKNALENVFVKKTDIQDNLISTDTNKPLSANQGKILDTNKVDKISGKSLSTNDFTNTYKTKLDNLDTLLESKANNTHTHGNLQNDGSIGTSNNINKNVITDGNGKITTEDKPSIPANTSDLTNDSGFLTEHQDISGKENISNKSFSITADTGSTTKYPTVKAVEDYAVQKIPMGDVYGVSSNSTSLQRQIQSASSGDTIVLDKDYLNNSNTTHILFSSKNITIIGNGHIIDGNNKLITFNASGTTTLKISNCVFQNLTLTTANTMFRATDSARIILDNCIFKNINVKTNSGIINTNQLLGNYTYTNAEIKILNSSFLSITGNTFLNFYDTNFSIINTIFENNAIDSILVKNTSSTNFTQEVINCVFNNNYPSITDSSTGVKSLVLKNNHFLQSGDTVTGCVNNNYLTEHQDISGKANSVHTHLTSDITDFPTIPSDLEDLTDDTGILHFDDYIAYDDMSGVPLSDFSNDLDVSDFTDSYDTEFTPKSHNHGNITNDGKCSTTGTVDVSRGDLLLFADATSNQYTIKGSTFVDALNDLILDLIDEGES